MKILHINKTDAGGGAAVASLRIHRALLHQGVDSMLLVQNKKRNEPQCDAVASGWKHQLESQYHFIAERLFFLPYEKEASLRFAFSPANSGIDISGHPMVREADILHLHWINQGFLSHQNLQKLFTLGKPIVWTLHDMWPFTGGCHYSGSCLEYNEHCGYCPFLKKPSRNDLSSKLFTQKKKLYSGVALHPVACSKWLRSLSAESTLFKNRQIISIPNPIDTEFYAPMNQLECRKALNLPVDKKLVLFGAANIMDVRKGFRYLLEALQIIKDNFPMLSEKMELVVFGKLKDSISQQIPFKIHTLNFISNPHTLVQVYNAADVFILPSLQDNLPNTVMESMSCGTPVVGFRIGGVPEMVQHEQTGFLAEAKNSLSLATGLYQTLCLGDLSQMGTYARQRALELYSQETVALQYQTLYQQILAHTPR